MLSQANLGVLQVEMPLLIRKMWREKELIRRNATFEEKIFVQCNSLPHREEPRVSFCVSSYFVNCGQKWFCGVHVEYPNLLFVVVFLYISEAACV